MDSHDVIDQLGAAIASAVQEVGAPCVAVMLGAVALDLIEADAEGPPSLEQPALRVPASY